MPEKPQRKLDITNATEIEEEIAEFLIPKRVPRGQLTIIAGMPDKGKSFWLCEIAACITRGEFGDPPAKVLMSTTEDSIKTTLRPRLRAAGAVLENVDFVSVKVNKDDVGAMRFPDDLQLFADAVEAGDYRLVTIDPILGHINSSVMSSFKDEQLRDGLMTPLARIAQANDCAIVGCMHLNKRSEGEALLRVSGSLGGLVGPARSVVMLHDSPEDEDQRILTHEKSNLGPKGKALVYEFEEKPLQIQGKHVQQSHLKWIGEADYTGHELLTGPKETPAKVQEAVEFLEAELADGAKPSADLKAAAKDQGITFHALNNARKKLGIKPQHEGFGKGSRWTWELPFQEIKVNVHHKKEKS